MNKIPNKGDRVRLVAMHDKVATAIGRMMDGVAQYLDAAERVMVGMLDRIVNRLRLRCHAGTSNGELD